MSTSPSLQIAVIGVGNVGSCFAFQLSRAGHTVTVVPRTNSVHHQQLARDQAILDVKGERAHVFITDSLNESFPYDLILVTILSHHVFAVLPALQRSRARHIQFMFIVFDPESLRDAVGVERCSFGMPVGVHATADKVKGRHKFTISSKRKTLHGDQQWVSLFNAAGLPSSFESNMMRWLRCRVPIEIAFVSACITAERRGRRVSWSEAMTIVRGMQESYTLINAMGHELYPEGMIPTGRLPGWMMAFLFWSMTKHREFREEVLHATSEDECTALLNVLLNAAKAVNLPEHSMTAIQAMRPTEETQPAGM